MFVFACSFCENTYFCWFGSCTAGMISAGNSGTLFFICYDAWLWQQGGYLHGGSADWAFQSLGNAWKKTQNPDDLKRKCFGCRTGKKMEKKSKFQMISSLDNRGKCGIAGGWNGQAWSPDKDAAGVGFEFLSMLCTERVHLSYLQTHQLSCCQATKNNTQINS